MVRRGLAEVFHIISLVREILRRVAGTPHFTQIDRDALIQVGRLQIVEDIDDRLFVVAAQTLVCRSSMSPLADERILERIIVRVVVVDGHHQAVGAGVVRGQDQAGDCEARVARVARNAQPAGCILPAGGADGVHEGLVPLVQDLVLGARVLPERFAPAPAPVLDLVEGLEHEPFALVLETFRDLGPDSKHLVLHLLVVRRIVDAFADVLPVILVVMGVHDGHKAGLLGITDDFRDAVQPTVFDPISRSRADVTFPGRADADGLEPGRLDAVHRGLGAFGIAPDRLAGHAVVDGIHMVAHVPARSHRIEHHLRGEGRGGGDGRSDERLLGNGNGHGLASAGNGEGTGARLRFPAGTGQHLDGGLVVLVNLAGLDHEPGRVGRDLGLGGRRNREGLLSTGTAEGQGGLADSQLHFGMTLQDRDHQALLVPDDPDVGRVVQGSVVGRGLDTEGIIVPGRGPRGDGHPVAYAGNRGLDPAGDGQGLRAAFRSELQFSRVGRQFHGIGGRFLAAAGDDKDGQRRKKDFPKSHKGQVFNQKLRPALPARPGRSPRRRNRRKRCRGPGH